MALNELTPTAPVVLASASPRRRTLLNQIGVPCDVHVADIDEAALSDEVPAEYVLRVALAKARSVRTALAEDPRPVLAADTAVVLGDRILGKPRDREEALRTLQRLSGKEHKVMTGVALSTPAAVFSRLSVSHVWFRDIQPAEMEAYWGTGEPRDKAGSYAIQGLGGLFVKEIRGSYSGIVGLPLLETADLLGEAEIHLLA
ncbi:MAG: Maf family protein [Pseudomonadota bacterium]